MWEHERSLWTQGCRRVAGIDEAGRGPLAGPVVAACCILPQDFDIQGINDSKQLSEPERERLYGLLVSNRAVEYGIGFCTSQEIDRINILKATFLAMSRSLAQLKTPPQVILVDGSLAPSFGIPTIPLVKGDSISVSIAAASILAKVTRDRMMGELDKQYPQYGFKDHKGYGTQEHLDSLQIYGPCTIHRNSFDPIKSFDRSLSQMELF